MLTIKTFGICAILSVAREHSIKLKSEKQRMSLRTRLKHVAAGGEIYIAINNLSGDDRVYRLFFAAVNRNG